mmetsp:Transcript_51176/g.125677  ORF Transcript_51176/g.125677 Transcript_51176/m.125677 type:complete len:486 (+) Transcript_51176:292-1749(+)
MYGHLILLALLPAAVATGPAFKTCLTSSGIFSPTYLPTDGAYQTQFEHNHITRDAPMPQAFFLPASASQIVQALGCARQSGLGVCTRAGGHSWSSSSLCNGVVIDLQQLKRMKVRNNRRKAYFDAGITTGEAVYRLVTEHGLVIPSGTCTSVGLTGWTLSGGIGTMTGEVGLGCDQVARYKMILANGTKVVAASDKNPDLFRAMCGGGGGHFAIVYGMVLKMHSAATYNEVVHFEYMSTAASTAAEVIKDWNDFDHDSVSSNYMRVQIIHREGLMTTFRVFGLCWRSDVPTCEARLTNYGFLSKPGMTRTKMIALDSVLKALPLVAEGTPADYFRHFAGRQKGNYRESSSVVWTDKTSLPLSFYENLVDILRRSSVSGTMSIAQWSPLHGSLRAKANSESTFRFRDADSSWDQYFFGTRSMRKMFKAEFKAAVAQSGNKVGTYANYADKTVPVSEYYPDGALEELRRWKVQLDPDNLFLAAQPLL